MAGDGMLTPVTAHWGDIHFAPWCPMALQPRFLGLHESLRRDASARAAEAVAGLLATPR